MSFESVSNNAFVRYAIIYVYAFIMLSFYSLILFLFGCAGASAQRHSTYSCICPLEMYEVLDVAVVSSNKNMLDV